jgi:hypothetical protein
MACVCLTATKYEDDGFQPLFDGRTLQGWQVFGGRPEAWSVEDGLLVSQGHGGGWLGSTRDYGDFVLKLEFRLSPGSNSGVYLRAPADTSHISRTGMEIQVLDEDDPRHREIQPWQKTGAIYHVAPPKPGHLKPAGEWNRLEVHAHGPRIVVYLNDACVVNDRLDQHPDLEQEHTGLRRASGRVGLQSHNDRVEFRSIRIKALGTEE